MNYIVDMLKRALSKKACLKHPVAAVIETINQDYVLGWNGAPTRGAEHLECSRKGQPHGVGMQYCPTVHAERRAISHAARDGAKKGISLEGATIYMSEWFPCADCAKSIIEAGIEKIVTPDEFYQDKNNRILMSNLQNQPYNFEMAEKLLYEAGIKCVVDPSIRPPIKVMS
jgi:dCMP deaminase